MTMPTPLADTNATQPLGRHEERWWPRDRTLPSDGQKAGAYEVFIPARIARRPFPLDDPAVAAVARATRALGALAGPRPQLVTAAALARNLLRSESAASSRIEGKLASQATLARAAYARAHGRRGDNRAAEVLGNVEAMERAIAIGARAEQPLSVADILDVHRTLLRFTVDADIAGVTRTSQNWIGGNDHHPIGATHVPPPHDEVTPLLEDLSEFAARDDLAAVAQAAIIHAQFENIHPFADGNGRTGRALIYTVLRRRREIGELIAPISLSLAAQPKAYANGLGAYSTGRVSLWVARFADATTRAAQQAERLAASIDACQRAWLERLGQPRADSAARQLVALLPSQPLIDVAAGQQATGKSHVAIGKALAQLQEAGIVAPLNERRWGRVWECTELLELVERCERDTSTP
jgi:Fic family protein